MVIFRANAMHPPIFFIHPPKSGGSTVVSFFDLNKGKDQFVNFELDRQGWESCRTRLLASRIGGGHQSYGIHKSLKSPLTYCTILRDPLARQVSHYWYAFNGKNGEVVRGASVSAAEALVQRGNISLDEWVTDSLAGKNLFVQMLSGHSPLNESSLEVAQANLRRHIRTAGVCENMSEFLLRLCGNTGLELPFYFETNKTSDASRNRVHLSEAAREKFIEENRLDYEIFRQVNKEIESHAREAGSVFSKALELVHTVQGEINQLENPYAHSSIVFGFDEEFLSKVRNVVSQFDLAPIEEYIRFAQDRRPAIADMHYGFVDAVSDGMVSGWVVNLSRPEERVLIEVSVGTDVIASGWNGLHRPDVSSAGYPSSYTGFSIPLPAGAPTGFHVGVANSQESLLNAGVWRKGWYCA
jgi:hypothetical protein